MRVVVAGLMGMTMCVAIAVVVMMVASFPDLRSPIPDPRPPIPDPGVPVSVSMIVIVRMRLGMLVRVDGYRLFADDAELRRANAGTAHRFGPD